MTEDRPVPSPRTVEEPMAFTRDELIGGALRTWSLFVALFVCFAVVPFVGTSWDSIWFVLFIGGYAGVVSAVIAAFAAVVLTPLIWIVGRALRREHRLAVHLVVYILIGGVVAAIAAAMAELIGGGYPGLAVLAGVIALIAVPLGWWLTARTALRSDRGISPRRRRHERVDVDARVEDGALG